MGTLTPKGVRNMDKEQKKPRVLPNPLPQPGLVDPIIAHGTVHFPGKSEVGKSEVVTDPNGSYTGRPVDGGVPVQDVDDL